MAAKSRTRWIVIALLGAALLGALAMMFMPRPVAVDIAEARRAEIAETVQDQGQARVREAYVVAAPVAGRLERMLLEPTDQQILTLLWDLSRPPAAPGDPAIAPLSQSRLARGRASTRGGGRRGRPGESGRRRRS